MNQDIILKMVTPYLKSDTLTYEEFENIFCILSLKEQYQVSEFLYSKGIDLIDGDKTEVVLPVDFNEKPETELLYDEAIFRDSVLFQSITDELDVNKDIKQSNEILCTLIQQGNRQAIQDLCIKNRGLVGKYASIYQKKNGNRLDIEDLEQVGYLGLIKASQRFDIRQGTAFSTYAVYWIKQCISREIMDNGYAIRIPVHMMERIYKVLILDNAFDENGLSYNDRMDAISSELNLSHEEVKECLILNKNYLLYSSLNTPIGEDEESELGEFIPDDEEYSVEEIIEEKILHEEIEKVLLTLTEREQKVLRMRFGLDDGIPRTLEEIGNHFDVTRERIRQIENKAIGKLRHPSRVKRLKDFV